MVGAPHPNYSNVISLRMIFVVDPALAYACGLLGAWFQPLAPAAMHPVKQRSTHWATPLSNTTQPLCLESSV